MVQFCLFEYLGLSFVREEEQLFLKFSHWNFDNVAVKGHYENVFFISNI